MKMGYSQFLKVMFLTGTMLDTGLKQPKEAEKHQLWVEGHMGGIGRASFIAGSRKSQLLPGFCERARPIFAVAIRARSIHPMVSPRNGIGILLTRQYTHLRSISKGE